MTSQFIEIKILNMKFSFRARLRSFGFAFMGFRTLLNSEHNARIHLLATILALIAGFALKISETEWALILIVIGMVWSAEAFNSAIEKLCDIITLEKNQSIKHIKDIAAFGVLITAFIAFVVGCLIFIPAILK